MATEKDGYAVFIKRYLKKHKKLLNIVETSRRMIYRYIFAVKHRQMIKKYLDSHKIRRLQIGSGRNCISDWLNTDRDTALSKETVFLDASKKLPFNNCTFNYIYHEHFIEHIEYSEGVRLIQECFRVLKPSGKIRISTPDLNFLVELFAENKSELQKRYIEWAVLRSDSDLNNDTFVINNFFQSWGHKFIYDFKTLKEVLVRAGFMNIRKCRVGESDDKNLQDLEHHNYEIGDEFNKLESLVVEATKPVYT